MKYLGITCWEVPVKEGMKMFRNMTTLVLSVVASIGPVSALRAQGPPSEAGIYQAITSDTSPRSLHEMAKGTVMIPGPAQPVFLGRIPFAGDSGPAAADTALQSAATTPAALTPGAGFDGVGVGLPGGFAVRYAPPDTNLSVGADFNGPGSGQIVQWVNASFAVFSKSGAILQAPVPGNTPWQGFGGGCETNNDGDPIVLYDKVANRWIFTQFSVSTKPYLQCFAVSSGPDAINSTYFRFAFSFGSKDFPDYPKLGVWPSGYFLSFNIFRNGFLFSGPRACAVDRSKALAGVAPSMICYQLSSSTGSLLPADLDGSTLPPSGSPEYFVAYATNALQVWKFNPNFGSPANSTFTGPANLPVAAFSRACNGGACIPQAGTTQKLDSLADRVMYRLAYRNRGGTESLLVNHSVTSPTSASGIRWYELRINSGSPSVYQQGTFAPADTTARWMGSVAMDRNGNIAVGYSASSTSIKPGIRFTGRCAGDQANQLQAETVAVAGTGAQLTNLSRWGDYSSMSVDPSDDSTFWFTTEYLKSDGTFNWSTRIFSISFSGCP